MYSKLPIVLMAGQDVVDNATMKQKIKSYQKNDGERYLYDINKNLISIRGMPIVQGSLEAALNSERAGDIAIVGPQAIGDYLADEGYIGANDSGNSRGHRIVFAEQSNNRISNALIGNEAIGVPGLKGYFGCDMALLRGDGKLLDSIIKEQDTFLGRKSLIWPFIARDLAHDEFGESYRPDKSWVMLRKADWQSYYHDIDSFIFNNIYVKESNAAFANIDDPEMKNLEQLGDGSELVKQRGLANKLKGALFMIGTIFKNEGWKSAYAIPDALQSYGKAQLAKKLSMLPSGTQDGFARAVSYMLGLSTDSIELPQTKILASHLDIDSLEDAYWVARLLYRRENGKDIESFEDLEEHLRYEKDSRTMSLIDAVGYDKENVQDFPMSKEESYLIADTELDRSDTSMKELFYWKMNRELAARKASLQDKL